MECSNGRKPTGYAVSMFSMPASIKRLPALDGIRGVAVLLTFGVHFAGGYMAKFRGGNPDQIPLNGWNDLFDKVLYWTYHSHHGVFLFFILSGFLIAKIVLNARAFSYYQFFYKRLLRIYPAFLAALVICVALPIIAYDRPFPSVFQIAGNLAFLNAFPQTGIIGLVFNNVTWSLFFEFAFYILFPIIVGASRKVNMNRVLSLVLGGLVVSYLPFIAGLPQTELFLLFFAGALIGSLREDVAKRLADRMPATFLIAIYFGLTTMHTVGYISAGPFVQIFAVVAALIVLKVAYSESWLKRVLSVRPLVWLGEVSYSFYLTHSIVLVTSFAAIGAITTQRTLASFGVFQIALLSFVLFGGALMLAAISFALFERPYFNDRRRHLSIGQAPTQA